MNILGDEIPPTELTPEEIDVKEMSAKRVMTLVDPMTVTLDTAITAEVPAGSEVTVMQSVRNPGMVVVHLDHKLARIYGTGKCWTEQKIYRQFGKQYHATLQAWDEMVNVLATTEIPEDEIKPI
jgi:hypothetical protein